MKIGHLRLHATHFARQVVIVFLEQINLPSLENSLQDITTSYFEIFVVWFYLLY